MLFWVKAAHREVGFFRLYTAIFAMSQSFFRRPGVALFGNALALLASIRHNVWVYQDATAQQEASTWSLAYIIFMLVAIDWSLLTFTVFGQRRASQAFAWLIFGLNLYYFWKHKAFPGWTLSLAWLEFAPGLIFSSIFAYAQYFFTELFASFIEEDSRLSRLREESQAWKERFLRAENARKDLEQEREARENEGKSEPAYQALEQKYLTALSMLAQMKGLESKTAENLRASASHYRKSAKKPGVSKDKAQEYLVSLDMIEAYRAITNPTI